MMKQFARISLFIIVTAIAFGVTPVAAQAPLQQQEPATDCTAQACTDTLQSAPALPSQPQSTPLQSAPDTSPQSGTPLQPATKSLDVIGADAFEPATSFDASLLWIAIALLALGLIGLAVLALLLKKQSFVHDTAVVVETESPEPVPDNPTLKTALKTSKKRTRKNRNKKT